jgi:hypothetical protein
MRTAGRPSSQNPEGLFAIKIYENKDLVRIRIRRKFYERL